LKIGINATCINDKPTGAKQRFLGIYGDLVKRLPEAEFVVYEPLDCRVGDWFRGAPNVSVKLTPLPSEGRARKFVNGLRYWHTALSRERFDIFEGLNLPLVKAPIGQTLLTIHDIRGIHAESGILERAAYGMFLERSLRSADHVITVSEAMKREILQVFPGLPISVVYNGLDTQGFDAVFEVDQQAVRRKYDLPSEFILAVGHLERRKNYLRLVDAIARLRDQGRSCSLLIVGNNRGGKDRDERKAIEERINAADLSGSVKILSDLSDFEVRCVYKLCTLFVFPSSYEGFGIPILEAMAAGRPMVLSDIPVFREITESRGIYFPHDDIEAMASAMEKVLSSSSDRARLIEYGNERVLAFSFNSLAAQLEGIYRSLMPHSVSR
jgi:glycosyltransferase involved in cell wall biosynthesis